MRVINNGIATNFGLVGKSLRKYLTTTALTATGLMAIATPALADNWVDHVATEGSISVDTSAPNTTNITQHTDFTKVQGDGDINAGWTVNVAQPSSSSKYVLYDTENDPTMIMGALNANGQIYIFDKNGVIFGKDSQVNVGSIVASTGTISDANLKADKLVFENVGGPDAGEIVNNGTITVAEAGLAAFVAPTVKNAGVISANAGKVVLAAGETVAIDLYGDNLVSIAADGALEEALVENSGAIAANGGKVVLSAQAAKSAVDNVINMDGVIDVSSVTVKGGKIVLDGGKKGKVNVNGVVNASGKTGGGDVKIAGETIETGKDAVVVADAVSSGNGGTINSFAEANALYRGRFYARGGAVSGNGGFVELSAKEGLGYEGSVNTSAANGEAGQFLLDPAFAIIHSGSLDPIGWSQLVIRASNLAKDMHTNGSVTVEATNTIDVGTDILFPGIGNGDIDVSTYNYNQLEVVGWTHVFGPIYLPVMGLVNYNGANNGNLTLKAATVNFNKNLIMGGGTLDVLATTINLGAKIFTNSALMVDSALNSTANTINVLSNNASIQQAVSLAKDSGGTTVNVASGTYNESVNVNKSVVLKGAKAGVAGSAAGRGINETIIDPSSPGFLVTANDVTIDGFTVTGADIGIHVNGANNVTVKNNIVHDVTEAGIQYDNAAGAVVEKNLVYNTGKEGIRANNSNGIQVKTNIVNNTDRDAIALYNSKKAVVTGNYIGFTGALVSAGTDNIYGDGILLNNSDGDATTKTIVQGNTITETNHNSYNKGSGINAIDTDYILIGGTASAQANKITNARWDGIRTQDLNGAFSTNTEIKGNNIENVGHTGIYAARASNIIIDKNVVKSTTSGISQPYGAISINEGHLVTVSNNQVSNASRGIMLLKVTGETNIVRKNTIKDVTDDGIYLEEVARGTVDQNYITNAVGNGINIVNSTFIMTGGTLPVLGNAIYNSGENGIRVQGGSTIHLYNNKVDGAAGDGVHAVGTNDLLVLNNTIRNNYNGSGVHVENSQNTEITANFIHDNLDGIKIVDATGGENFIYNNRILYIENDGVNVSGATQMDITKNRINGLSGNGIIVDDADEVLVGENQIWDVGTDSIHVSSSGNTSILGNKTERAGDDGIEVVDNYGYLLISGNTVTDSGITGLSDSYGGDGIHVRGSSATIPYGSEETFAAAVTTLPAEYAGYLPTGNIDTDYAVVVYNNTVTNSGDDGIEVVGGNSSSGSNEDKRIAIQEVFGYNTNATLVLLNNVTNSGVNDTAEDSYGSDGIHVRNVYGDYGYSDFAVEILGNTVDQSTDDGIETRDTGAVRIASNTVANSGYAAESEEGGSEEVFAARVASGYDDYGYGNAADGIHVHNASRGGLVSLLVTDTDDAGSGTYDVEILDNDVTNSGDDGVQVVWSGNTLIDLNTITNSGLEGSEGALGGDGISVVGVDGGYDGWFGEYYFNPLLVVASNNTVTNSLDDGIEILGGSDVYVNGNTVTNSGDDGINLLGFAAFGEDDGEGEEEGEEGSEGGFNIFDVGTLLWTDFYAEVTGNTVTTSGGDGIEASGFDTLRVTDGNNVSGSVANGLYVSGYNNRDVIVSGNIFSNNDIGAQFESGVIDLRGAGNSFTGGRIGLRFAPYAFGGEGGPAPAFAKLALDASLTGFAPLSLVDDGLSYPNVPGTFSGTIGSQTFTGYTEPGKYYVELVNEAFYNPGQPTLLNGLNSTYDGFTPSVTDGVLDDAQFDYLEARFNHYPDGQLIGENLGLFWFGFVPDDLTIEQKDLFNTFGAFNGDITGLNVRIVGLPRLPGQTGAAGNLAQTLNNLQTFAGGPGTTPADLNNIETAAGGSNPQGQNQTPDDLANIETEAGGDDNNANCWSDAMTMAGGGQAVNVVYGGTIDASLEQAASCGTSF